MAEFPFTFHFAFIHRVKQKKSVLQIEIEFRLLFHSSFNLSVCLIFFLFPILDQIVGKFIISTQ